MVLKLFVFVAFGFFLDLGYFAQILWEAMDVNGEWKAFGLLNLTAFLEEANISEIFDFIRSNLLSFHFDYRHI